MHREKVASLTLGIQPIFLVDRLKYLGILCFVSAIRSFNVDVSINIRRLNVIQLLMIIINKTEVNTTDY